jgi:N-acyl-D-amino-acid deacylase
MTADQYPYAASMTGLSNILPTHFLNTAGVKEEYWSKEGKKEIQAAAEKIFEEFNPQKILLALCQDNPSYEGKRLQEIADLEGRSPAETYVEMVCTKNSPMAVYFSMREEDVREFMRRDFVFCASDGGTIPMGVMKPHPRFYGTFPKKIRKYALDEKVIDLKSAIRSMTSLPAEKFDMKGRGKIEKGYFADICAIDLESFKDKSTYTNPHQYAEGIVHLWVNGVPTINNREVTAKRGGRPIRRA